MGPGAAIDHILHLRHVTSPWNLFANSLLLEMAQPSTIGAAFFFILGHTVMGHCLCLVVDPPGLADAEPTVSTWVRSVSGSGTVDEASG